ncbi:TPA: hypothetical protein NK087_000609 [Vibrio parahaemolyticus]|nr:hypothetical protein [Vibrio parahaemolyticus]
MNYENNIIQVKCNSEYSHESSGYAFKSQCNQSSFVLTSKHSVCLDKVTCAKLKDKESENPCRACDAKIDNDLILVSHLKEEFKVKDIHLSESSDVALLVLIDELEELCFLTCLPNKEKQYQIWRYDKERILLDSPTSINDGYIRYNISSNINAELKSKGNVVKGYSGTPVITESGDKIICHAIITDDERLNDLGAEVLSKSLISELSEKSGVILDKNFSILSNGLDIDFINNFNHVDTISLPKRIELKIYASHFDNEFILDSVARHLFNNLKKSIMNPKEYEEDSGDMMSLINVLQKFMQEDSNSYSKSALMQNIIESDLFAPKLYSSSKDNEYSSVHIREKSPNSYELIFAKFNSSNSLLSSLSDGIDDIKTVKKTGIDSKFMLNESIVNQQVSSEQASILSAILLPHNEVDVKRAYGLLSTFVPSLTDDVYLEDDTEKKNKLTQDEIKDIINSNLVDIAKIFEDKTLWGSSYYLYVIPINKVGELRDKMMDFINGKLK